MATNGELVQEGGGREEGEEDMDMDDEATFLSLEFALTGHHSSAFDHHEDEEKDKDNTEDGKWIHGRQLVAAVEASHRGDAVSEALGKTGPATMLRTLMRKLRRWKAAGPGYPSASRGRAVAALEDGNRFLAKGEVQPEAARRPGAGAVTSDSEERWTPMMSEAALKYLSKMPILACRRGVGDGPDDTSPRHHLPVATTTTVLPAPGRRSRGETGPRQACKRLGISRSSVAASPPPTPQRRDDSLLQAQDGIASAIAYCKLSLTTSRGFESPKVSFRG